MERVIENVKLMQDGVMVFDGLHLEDGFTERIDYKTLHMVNGVAILGLMDIRIRGFHGYPCEGTDIGNLYTLTLGYPKRGIASFYPTVSARLLNEFRTIISTYRGTFWGDHRGVHYEGMYLEGLYLDPGHRGSMERESLMEIHLGELEDFLPEYHDDIKTMTIAPDIGDAMEVISLLHLYGVEISLGHTNTDFTQANEAPACGATQITHLGSTVPEITHHKPGMMNAIFLSDCLHEAIMDGVHTQGEILKWAIRLPGCNCAVTVGNGASFSSFHYPDGYELEGGSVVRNGVVYKEDILLDSSYGLLDISQYPYKQGDCNLSDCIRMRSTSAAGVLRIYTREIGLGKNINPVILGHDVHMKEVIINGGNAL